MHRRKSIPGATTEDRNLERPVCRMAEMVCPAKYGNQLPDVPFDLKCLKNPLDMKRFIPYKTTTLERNYQREVLTEKDLGIKVELINSEVYKPDATAQIHPDDEKLLEEEEPIVEISERSRQHARSVSWLRKPEYISTDQTRFQPQNGETIESKVGYNVKKGLIQETLYMDRDAQIEAIEKTFSDVKLEIKKHHSKPNVVPVEVLPIYPDFKNWKFPCAEVVFDSDPAPASKNKPEQIAKMSEAMIRGVKDENGEEFVAYFLPTAETLEKRRKDLTANKAFKNDEKYEYKMEREYNWNVKSKASKGYDENYLFAVREDGVFYDELETRVRLNRRRVKGGQRALDTKLVVKHRPLDAREQKLQRYRESQLEPLSFENEEQDEEADAEEEQVSVEGQQLTEPLLEDEGDNSASAAETDKDGMSCPILSSKTMSGSPSRSLTVLRSNSKSPSHCQSGSSGASEKYTSESSSESMSKPRSRT